MAIADVTKYTLFRDWLTITNQIKDKAETNSTNITILDTELGDLTNLSTDDQSSLVAAVNEVDGNTDTNAANIATVNNKVGDLANLTNPAANLVEAINNTESNVGDISSLNHGSPDVVTEINTVDSIFGTLANLPNSPATVEEAITNTNNDVGDLTTLTTTAQDSVVNAVNELDSVKLENTTVQYINKDENHGRFIVETDLAPATPTFTSGILQSENGSALVAGDKFINDNPANGSLGTNMTDLMTALSNAGRSQTQYGYEFYICHITAGNGTTDPVDIGGTNYYPLVKNNDILLGRIGESVTWQAWVRNSDTTNSFYFGNDTNVTTYVNGVKQTGRYELTYADGWVHVRQVITLEKEFETYFPEIRSVSDGSSILQIALQGLFDGEVLIPEHLGVL